MSTPSTIASRRPASSSPARALRRAFSSTTASGSPSRSSSTVGDDRLELDPEPLEDLAPARRRRGEDQGGPLSCAEPDPDLALGGLVGVGAVDEVEGDLEPVVAADRAGRGLDRVGRADQLAGGRDRLDALEHRGDQRAAGDERDQLAEERLLGVLGVVGVGDRLVGGEQPQLR